MNNKISCVVNSEGVVIDTSNVYNAIQIRNPKNRAEEILEFIRIFAENLKSYGIDVGFSTFTYKFQTYRTKDVVYLFIKIPLDASDPIVRKAYEFSRVFTSNELTQEQRLLRSIGNEQIKERTQWHILYAQGILLDRNIYDREWEQIEALPIMLYWDFLEMMKREAASANTQSDINNLNYEYEKGRDYNDIFKPIASAAAINNNGKPLPETPLVITNVISDCFAILGFEKKKPYGNIATYCLHAINDLKYTDKSKFYGIFKDVQKVIREEFPGAHHIHYEGNKIIFYEQYKADRNIIHVCNPMNDTDKQTMIINGKIFSDASSLRGQLRDAIAPCQWYNEVVIPNIK